MALNEQLEEITMGIIANAGAARSAAFEALASAKERRFDDADGSMAVSKEYAAKAHKAHSDLLQRYAKGEIEGGDILIAHAQDHLMCAVLAQELIHGTMVAVIALMPIIMQDTAANAAAVAAGQAAAFYPSLLFLAIQCAGGTGCTLGLILHGLRGKSEQARAVSKVALVPALFNINEPATFGYPIMYNPILAIPFMLTPVVTMLLVWVGYLIGFFKPAYVFIMSLMPLGVLEFLSSMAWQNILIPVVGIVVGLLIYWPFMKVYDRQLLAKEQAAAVAESAAAGA